MVESLGLLNSATSFTSCEPGAFLLVTGFSQDCDEESFRVFSGDLHLDRCSRWGHPLYAILKYESTAEAQNEIDRLDGTLLLGRRINVSWLFEQRVVVQSPEVMVRDDEGFRLLYTSRYELSAMEIEVRQDGRMRAAGKWWSRAGNRGKERKVFQEAFLSREAVGLLERILVQWQEQYEELTDNGDWPFHEYSVGREELEFVIQKKRTFLSSNIICSDCVYAEKHLMHRLASFLHTLKKLRYVFWCMINA